MKVSAHPDRLNSKIVETAVIKPKPVIRVAIGAVGGHVLVKANAHLGKPRHEIVGNAMEPKREPVIAIVSGVPGVLV